MLTRHHLRGLEKKQMSIPCGDVALKQQNAGSHPARGV